MCQNHGWQSFWADVGAGLFFIMLGCGIAIVNWSCHTHTTNNQKTQEVAK